MLSPEEVASVHAIIDRHKLYEAERLARTRALVEARKQDKKELSECRARLAQLQSTKGEGAAKPIAEIERLIGRIEARVAARAAFTDASTMTSAKLYESFRAGEFEAVERSFTVAKGESKADAVRRVRSTMTALRADRRTVATAPLPLSEVRRRAKEQIAVLAARGQPKTLLMFNGGEIEFPETEIYDPNPTRRYVSDGVALVAFLFQDELFTRLDEALKFNADDENALSDSKRAERLAVIDEELDTLGREEAALVEAIVADGGTAYHRAQANPLHVLGLRVVE